MAGVDEAGRGPLAGPVVAAAIVLAAGADLPGINDSKVLSATARLDLYPRILRAAESVGVGIAGPGEIDRINILQASLLAMRRALARVAADGVVVDGRHTIPGCALPQVAEPKADGRYVCVAAASVVAKVLRDRIMELHHRRWPEYLFAQHKGYPTPAHLTALDRQGPCAIHRQTFLVRWRERTAQAALTL